MTIIFCDGSTAECSEIEFVDGKIVWDGYRFADISDVEKIEE